MIYKFDSFEVDTDKFELRENGNSLHVGIQVFDFLHLLIKHRQRVVTREEIIDTIWGGRAVSETTISSCVKSARKALGDDGETQKFIRTARGRGFQFIQKIDQMGNEYSNDDGKVQKKPVGYSKIILLSAALIAFIILLIYVFPKDHNSVNSRTDISNNDQGISEPPSPRTIAVMPFADMSINGDQAYFGNGIAEEVLNELSKVNDLNVTSRTTSFSLRGQNLSTPEISDKLDVKYIVEGSVRNSENRIRITAQLIDAENDIHLWSDTYDRELTDIFAVQDEISIAVAHALNSEISIASINQETPTSDMAAYALYLQGHELFMERGTVNTPGQGEKLEQAMFMLGKAVELDPNFAEAWADLASVKLVLPTFVYSKYQLENTLQSALEAANRAISKNSKLSQAWAAKGFAELSQFNFQDAELALTRAVELNSRNETAWLWLSLHYASVGFHEEAIEAVKNAINLAPDVAINHGILSIILHAKGNIDEAIEVLDKAITERNYEVGRIDRVLLAIWNNDQERAFEEIELISAKYDDLTRDRVIADLELYVNAYFSPELRKDALNTLSEHSNMQPNITFYGAYLLKDPALMIEFFNSASSNTTFNLRRIYNPLVRSLFRDAIFREYIINIGLFNYWKDNKFPEFCHLDGSDDFMCAE